MEPNKSIYKEKNVTVEIERIFAEDKSIKELLLEFLCRKCETEGLCLL